MTTEKSLSNVQKPVRRVMPVTKTLPVPLPALVVSRVTLSATQPVILPASLLSENVKPALVVSPATPYVIPYVILIVKVVMNSATIVTSVIQTATLIAMVIMADVLTVRVDVQPVTDSVTVDVITVTVVNPVIEVVIVKM